MRHTWTGTRLRISRALTLLDATRSPRHFFLFDHIPKSGGTFFRDCLIQTFGADEVSAHFDCGPRFHETETSRILAFDRYRVVAGHLRLDTRTAFLRLRPRFTLSLVREPVALIASTYTYWRYNVAPGKNPQCDLAKEQSFSDFIRDPRVSMSCDNPMTRHLFSIWDHTPLKLEAAAMHLARRMTDSFAFFGVSERMEQSVALFLRMFVPDCDPGRIDFTRVRRRESLQRLAVSEADRAFLEQRNACDCSLYRHVCERFERDLARVP